MSGTSRKHKAFRGRGRSLTSTSERVLLDINYYNNPSRRKGLIAAAERSQTGETNDWINSIKL